MTREEAIKIVKEFINGTCLHLVDQEALETLIPELKESEDERIRKWLIDTIKSVPNDSIEWDVIDKSCVLAWLEKQKEQKPAEWSEDFEENIRSLLDDKLTGHSEDGTMTWTTFIDDKTLRDIVSGIWFYVGKEALKYPNKELNVAEWSEEDEEKRDDIVKIIEYSTTIPAYGKTGILKLSKEYKKELTDWIKSLKPQRK